MFENIADTICMEEREDYGEDDGEDDGDDDEEDEDNEGDEEGGVEDRVFDEGDGDDEDDSRFKSDSNLIAEHLKNKMTSLGSGFLPPNCNLLLRRRLLEAASIQRTVNEMMKNNAENDVRSL